MSTFGWLKRIAQSRIGAIGADGSWRNSPLLGRSRRPAAQRLRRWFHFSLIRLILLESRSAYYRIQSERCKSLALEFQEVRQSLPQVSCVDSRNETQYCSASIRKLSEDYPFLTLGDFRLFAIGFCQAARWFRHTDMQCRNGQQSSWSGNFMPPAATPQPTKRDL